MPTTATSIRIDPKIKNPAQKIAKSMGTNLSTIINMYLTQFVREKRLSIVLRDEEGFTPDASADLLALMKRIDIGEEEITGSFSTKEALFAHLDALKK